MPNMPCSRNDRNILWVDHPSFRQFDTTVSRAQELAMTVFDEQTGGPPRGRWHPGSHSHRNTRDAISVQMANTTTRAATSPTWADQVLPCQIPESNDTA